MRSSRATFCAVDRRTPLLLLLLAAAAPADDRYSPPERIADVRDGRITEASGLAASRTHAGLYYTHNDSGGRPEVFVLDRSGRTVATLTLAGAANVDWEDIAIAPRPGGGWDVCVGDIGDNKSRRGDVQIYRFAEPASAPAGDMRMDADRTRWRYADGPADAEGLAVHPVTGDAYVLTKQTDGVSRVYALPAAAFATRGDELRTAQRVAELRFPPGAAVATIVTAADISPDGRRLVTRSYLTAWERTLPVGESDWSAIWRAAPQRLDMPAEPVGEAISYAADGAALLTISERAPTALYEIRAALD